MSINQLVKPVTKQWLDTHIGGVTIDGELNYKNSDKANGDSLVLDANMVAQWVPVANLTLGSVLVARLGQATLNSSLTTYFMYASPAPHPAIYSIVDNNKLYVSETGKYQVISLLFATNSSASIAQEIAVNGVGVSSTRQVSGISPILGYIKENNIVFETVSLNAGDYISIIANSPSGAPITTFTNGSFLVISRLS